MLLSVFQCSFVVVERTSEFFVQSHVPGEKKYVGKKDVGFAAIFCLSGDRCPSVTPLDVYVAWKLLGGLLCRAVRSLRSARALYTCNGSAPCSRSRDR